jgi:CHAT domain-containing protein
LIISSDGLLSLLPFGLLVTGKSDLNFKDGSYLIKEKEIQYAYSSNLLFKSGQQEPLIRPKVLAMSYSDDHMEESGSEKYLELPYSAVEVDAIQRKFKQARSSILKGEHATESALRELIGSMDIVHLAVHGIGDVDYEYNSRLVFKSDKDSLDGQLFAHELYGLSHSLRLAVLSACETGIGKNYPGEGVFSIGRAFAVTGTPSLVMSLWEVPDHSTATIIANFYSHLSDGHRVSKALQLAKIDYLESQHRGLALPFYWAALIPMGDMSPLVKSNAKIPASILIFSILMVGLLVLWKSKR